MNLGELWKWEKKKLGCRIRPESGNPSLDELRERLSKLTGIEVPELLEKTPEETEQLWTYTKPGKRPKTTGSTRKAAEQMGQSTSMHSLMVLQRESLATDAKDKGPARMNLHKKYFQVPRAPPGKVVHDMHADKLARRPMTSGGVVDHAGGDGDSETLSLPKVTEQMVRRKKQRAQTAPAQETAAPVETPEVVAPEPDDAEVAPLFKLTYDGDLFSTRGSYMEGIIYQSRQNLADGALDREQRRPRAKLLKLDDQRTDRRELPRAIEREAPAVVVFSEHFPGPPSSSEATLAAESAARLHCATSIAQWSESLQNASRLAEEGAVAAILVLAKDESLEVKRQCSLALRRLSQDAGLCGQLLQLSAVAVISELGLKSTADAGEEYSLGVARNCATALVNLTVIDGTEFQLVEDGAVIGLVSLMGRHEQLTELCARALFNLTCVHKPYANMERVVKAFVALSSSPLLVVKHVCAAALCNVADIAEMRPRGVEEGVVQVLGALACGAEARTRRVCAIVLHSLASTKACRVDMVTKGAVQVLYGLSSDVDTITLHYVASATIRLAMEPANLQRLVNEGGVTGLCNICLRCPRDVATTRLAASALALLSQAPLGRHAIVGEGCVAALVTLLRESADPATLRQGLSAMTNLLVDEKRHTVVLQQGGVGAVIGLSSHSAIGIREACALALFNLSRGEIVRDNPKVASLAVPAIIALSLSSSEECRTRCAAALCKLAAVESNVALMVSEGVVDAFIGLLKVQRHPDVVKHCCAALCRLAQVPTSAVAIAQGALALVIAEIHAPDTDASTRRSCCAVLCAVSAHAPCRPQLCDMGALSALTKLSTSTDANTRLRCAVFFANLSFDPAVRETMVECGVVEVVAELSNSYCEENQLYCARCICNLGCCSREEAVVEKGGVDVCMMISMVRSVSPLTKKLCAMAILNLATPAVLATHLDRLATRGLVKTVSLLSRLDEEEVMSVTAQIFARLSGLPAGRLLLVEHRAGLVDAFRLLRSKVPATRVLAARVASDLISNEPYARGRAVDFGVGVPALRQICEMGGESGILGAEALLLIAAGGGKNNNNNPEWRRAMVATPEVDTAAATTDVEAEEERLFFGPGDCLPTLTGMLSSSSSSEAAKNAALRVLATLAKDPACRDALVTSGVIACLAVVVESPPPLAHPALTLELVTHCLLGETEGGGRRLRASQDGVLALLHALHGALPEEARHRLFLAGALRSLCETADALPRLVEDGVVRLLCSLVEGSDDGDVLQCAAQSLYLIAKHQAYNVALVDEGCLCVLSAIHDGVLCRDGVARELAATLHSLALTHRDRVIDDCRHLAIQLADSPKCLQSVAQCFYWLSRTSVEANRIALQDAGLVAVLVKLAKHESVATACSEALKSISAGTTTGIEEGTVAALISMTLAQSGGPVVAASRELVADLGSPDRLDEALFETQLEEQEKRAPVLLPEYTAPAKMPGGVAGKGPPPPEPPEMKVSDTLNLAFTDAPEKDEDEERGGAPMIFAKISAEALA